MVISKKLNLNFKNELGFLAKVDLEEGVLKSAKYFSNI